MLSGDFDPAEMSRAVGFCGRSIGSDLDANATNAIMSDVRRTIGAAVRMVARGFGAPRS
jgi:hypothetical protein